MWTRLNNKTITRDTHVFTTRLTRCQSFALFAPSLSLKEINVTGVAKFLPLTSFLFCPLQQTSHVCFGIFTTNEGIQNNRCRWECIVNSSKMIITQYLFFNLFFFTCFRSLPMLICADVVHSLKLVHNIPSK